ncbi:unnamed protein product [Dracunculus medinensis]|uniref:SCP domain-containing protein n=1 Tax=Dracunculus medinensis TaxID=318479 RepID=A0A0N4UHE0_DRAME|nr:unnamed protein product [Dracunculus medinensis]
MNDDIRSDILLKHNLIRSQLAHGYFKSLPSGSNIYSLQWSCELEGFAQRYAEFLSDICKLSRKQEIHLPFEIGQNIFKTRTKGNHTTEQWFDEALHFWTNGARESGSVAQILYGKTLLMGCGIHKCPGTEVVIVCQYWPKAIPGLLYEPSSSCETNDYCDAYNRSSCQSKMSLCKIPDSFAFPYPLRAIQFQTTKTDARITDAIYSKDGANSSKASEKIIEKFEKQSKNPNSIGAHLTYIFTVYWNCELEREAQMEVENCVMPSSGAQHKYYRTTIFNFEFDNLTTFLEQKTDRAIRNWWGNPMDNDNINIAQYEATDIGCGIAICVDENLQMVLDIVCRYWPTSDPNQLYSYAISCAQDEDCSSLPNSYCDTDLEICVEDK